jgi:hypothetical protein
MRGGGKARAGSNGDEQDEARSQPSFHADQHGQPRVDIFRLRPIGGGGKAGAASNGDKQDEARSRPFRHANQHG